jgi:UDP-glucose 6-dehydrogenase
MGTKVTVIGNGWVGQAMMKLFPNATVYSNRYYRSVEDGQECILEYEEEQWEKEKIQLQKEANKGDVAFICVPTPCNDEEELDTSIVEEVVKWCTCPLLVIRSTVNPGTCAVLSERYSRRILMQPEYLGETVNHPMTNQKERQFLVIGGKPEDRRLLIDLYGTVYNANINIRQVTATEAEVIKLTENRAISFKVAQCQELYDACEAAGIDYYTIRDAVYGDDPRFNLWWTFVYPDKRGFKSKCIPKDVYAWAAWAESFGYAPEITRGLLERNKKWICQ